MAVARHQSRGPAILPSEIFTNDDHISKRRDLDGRIDMKLAATAFLIAAFSTIACGASVSVGPAPAGDAKVVATKALRDAEHPCPRVTSATRAQDGSIKAYCSNREDYLIASLNGSTIALRCSA